MESAPLIPEEFRLVMDRAFRLMGDDPVMGPRLKAADLPHRLEFWDVDLVLQVRGSREGEPGHLHWEWAEEADFEARVHLTMSSQAANAFFQGRTNLALALAQRRIRSRGDVTAALMLVPVTKPVFGPYRAMLEVEYPHLVV